MEMTGFFEVFNPGYRHTREQRDLEKILVVEQKKGGAGPKPLDLESGRAELWMPARPAASAPTPDA